MLQPFTSRRKSHWSPFEEREEEEEEEEDDDDDEKEEEEEEEEERDTVADLFPSIASTGRHVLRWLFHHRRFVRLCSPLFFLFVFFLLFPVSLWVSPFPSWEDHPAVVVTFSIGEDKGKRNGAPRPTRLLHALCGHHVRQPWAKRSSSAAHSRGGARRGSEAGGGGGGVALPPFVPRPRVSFLLLGGGAMVVRVLRFRVYPSLDPSASATPNGAEGEKGDCHAAPSGTGMRGISRRSSFCSTASRLWEEAMGWA